MSFVWTPERCSALSELVSKKMSARQIAGELGLTRNAVIGKVSRLGLRLAGNPGHPRGPNKLTRIMFAGLPYSGARAKHKKRNQYSKVEEIRSLNIPMQELSFRACRYPTTADKPFLFCGLETEENQSYCEHHHFICYQPPKMRG